MQLIFIGESIKTIDAKAPGFLNDFPEVPWREVMGLRDIIAHEYHRIDADEIFSVIKNDSPFLLTIIKKMKEAI